VFLAQSERWGGRFSVPGGHIEFGERAEDVVVREVREETGLKVTPEVLLLVQQAIFPKEFAERDHFIFLDYLCRLSGPQRVRLDARELQGSRWVTPNEALNLELEPYTRTLLQHYLRVVTKTARSGERRAKAGR
jgi:nucleoside triphosphatase